MSFRHSAALVGALVAGAILATGGPALAMKHGHETETNVVPQAPGAATPQPALTLAPADPPADPPPASAPAAPQ